MTGESETAVCVSVIICSHNPCLEYMRRVLGGLRSQTLPLDRWELLLVDNVSDEPLSVAWDLSWHPNARHVREEELGLTLARLRGIGEAKAEVLIFVDDDNVLAPNYLGETLRIADEWPVLGAWGGTIKGEFEVPPEPWMRPLLGFLPTREFSEPIWSNNPDDRRAQPCGAGLSVRASVAHHYADKVFREPARRKLGRIGRSLSSCEDSDLAQTSCELSKGFGNFPQLVLTHLIPKSRVQPDYLIRLMQSITASGTVLSYLRSGKLPPQPNSLNVTARHLLTYLQQGSRAAQIYRAQQDAVRMGIQTALSLSRERLEQEGPT